MGDPRYQIDVSKPVFEQAHARARQEGWPSTSAWLRHLLQSWDGLPVVPRPRRDKQLSVRLDPHHESLLDRIASVSGTSHSETLAILVETALHGEPQNEESAVTDELPVLADYEPWEPGSVLDFEPDPSSRKAERSARPEPVSSHQAEHDEPWTEPEPLSSQAEHDEPWTEPELEPDPPSRKAERSAGLFDLAEFARLVQESADSEPHARFGERTFISAVWRRFKRHPMAAGMSERQFKDHLIEANRADLLALHRADLVAAMNSDEVRDSETRHLNATFHFIESPRRAPRDPPHART